MEEHMAKKPELTVEAIIEAIDAMEFEDIAKIKEASSDKLEAQKHLVRDQLSQDLKAKLQLYNFTPEELGLFPPGSLPRTSRKPVQRQMKGGPCKVCDFETSPPHDARAHRSQGDDKQPFTAQELEERGMSRV